MMILSKTLAAKYKKTISWSLFTIMVMELLCPNVSYALSSGPVQPEIQSFEPVGTTDMVDMFTGDFVYNIPLMDVEGYPINISYHGGVTMDQEASWVGLGWNINPGAINRAVRGLPDEFNGDIIEKELHILDERTTKIGLNTAAEVIGAGEPYFGLVASLGGYLTISNYRGMSVDLVSNVGVNAKYGAFSGGLNIGASIGSQSGASINYGGNLGVGISRTVGNDMAAGGSFNLNYGGTYNPRTGLKRQVGFSVGAGLSGKNFNTSTSTGYSVPIGTQNHTVALTNNAYMNSSGGQLKGGYEMFLGYGTTYCYGSFTTTHYEKDGSRKGYGYFNLSEATDHDLLDFSREKDGLYNTTMKLLPQAHLTYDVYSISGQGTGGSFRPYRNDFGSVYDPVISSPDDTTFEIKAEAGYGNVLEIGGDLGLSQTKLKSGPWAESDAHRPFRKPRGGIFEDIYFKEAGELTRNNEKNLDDFATSTFFVPESARALPAYKTGSEQRIVRANHIYPVSGEDKDTVLILDSKDLHSYTDTTGFKTYPTVNKETIARVSSDAGKQLKRKPSQVTEIIQTQKDGRRYVYGLPVVNNVQREVVFSVDGSNSLNESRYLVDFTPGVEDSDGNTRGIDHYYSSSVTPTYVAAHLLTNVLSADYIDVTGNGVSDDDLGSYTKFNYSRKSADYRWRAPVQSGKAQYQPGYKLDTRDDKASYMVGSREQWMMHSIETRNYVAEFYVSERQDALGVLDKILNGGSVYNEAPYNSALSSGTKDNRSYKLDSIVLYNKHDRFTNNVAATPVKTVIFTYDYSLCRNVPNAIDGAGKLTLKKIQTRYGRSNINMSAAYNFTYSDLNPDYHEGAKDRWGGYKAPAEEGKLNNFLFPFVTQSSVSDEYAGAWSLTEIGLPSGGVIKVDYEADDYAYVQTKEAMEMFKVEGFGFGDDISEQRQYMPFHLLYLSSMFPPHLTVFFKRRQEAENPLLSLKDNYLKGTDMLYYNISVGMTQGRFEPVKGYARALYVGACTNNSDYGYVLLMPSLLEGDLNLLNPMAYTAMNFGRYSIPHIMFPGSDPEVSDIKNIVAGLSGSVKELFNGMKNPLKNYMDLFHYAQSVELSKSFIRLTSPGLKKKGGGHRVKSVRFYDSWDDMAGGREAVYGKNYSYTKKRDDGKGIISSGVASYEPLIGGDELPQRIPVNYTVQDDMVAFPPNDPVELYQELPVGEGFYPGAVVGYSNVVATSIHKDVGRSAQTEEIHGFYTAKDFPIQAQASPIMPFTFQGSSWASMSMYHQASQGFSFVFNDMHGKPRNTENWMLKPADTVRGRELVSRQQYEYLTTAGKLDNMVPVFDYNANEGKLSVTKHKMGLETDITFDTRMRSEVTTAKNLAANFNASNFGPAFVSIFMMYPYFFENTISVKLASATKVTQQYGILSKVTSTKEGAVTEMRNEVFDQFTGNALVTSVNNEYGDREYTVSYPAYWAYKELGPCYQNFNAVGKFKEGMVIDSLGTFASRFVNYNPFYSFQYALNASMPVAKIQVDEDMPKFKLGDEMLLMINEQGAQPIRTWTMGYTSDEEHCYLILAPREPYKLGGSWTMSTAYNDVFYRVIRSGNKNRLGEVIQTYTTTNRDNIFPYLKDSVTDIISLTAQTYKYNLNQVFAANMSSDSLNPFVTGKVGEYRPETQVFNLKNRDYAAGMARTAGLYAGKAYWKVESDRIAAYCSDTFQCVDCGVEQTQCPDVLDSLRVTHIGTDSYGNDSFKVVFYPFNNEHCSNPDIDIYGWTMGGTGGWPPGIPYGLFDHPSFNASVNTPDSFVFVYPQSNFELSYDNGCCGIKFDVVYDAPSGDVYITNPHYRLPGGGSTPVYGVNVYRNDPSYEFIYPLGSLVPYRIRKKIFLGMVGKYDGDDNEDWIKTQQVTKYNWFGQELENKEEGLGYNSALYGYNQQLPMCVAKNARHSEVFYESFEDYALLKAKPDKKETYMSLLYSPFESFFNAKDNLGNAYYLTKLAPSGADASISSEDAHTGTFAIKVSSSASFPLNGTEAGMAQGYSFRMKGPRKYVTSVWIKSVSPITDSRTAYSPNGLEVGMDTVSGSPSGAHITAILTPKSNIIEGWQKFEAVFDAPAGYKNFKLHLPGSYFYDDVRVFPFESNSKGFVYHPVTRKLMATLDENNYATFYEYDAEGNLVRTKKETEKGILTITESRSTHRKAN